MAAVQARSVDEQPSVPAARLWRSGMAGKTQYANYVAPPRPDAHLRHLVTRGGGEKEKGKSGNVLHIHV